MEFRQLEYFVAVAQEASFTRAAAKVHISQPGLSAQVRQLEREFGQALLDRSGRTVRLTPMGSAVLPYARAVLQAVAGVRQAVDELTGLARGSVAVGMVVSCGALDVPKVLAEYHRQHPAVELTLEEANSADLVRALEDGRLDVAFIGTSGAPPPGIETCTVAEEVLVAAVARSDPWATRSSITLRMLQDRDLISLPRGTGLRSCLDSACLASGLRSRITLEASNPVMVADLACRGLGVAILPESVALSRPGGLRVLSIRRPVLRAQVALAWRRDAPMVPAARAFIEHARTVLSTRTRS